MDVKETVRKLKEIEAPELAALRAQLITGEALIDTVTPNGYHRAVAALFLPDGSLAFRCFGFSGEGPASYWYEIGGEEGGPMNLTPEGTMRLRAYLLFGRVTLEAVAKARALVDTDR